MEGINIEIYINIYQMEKKNIQLLQIFHYLQNNLNIIQKIQIQVLILVLLLIKIKKIVEVLRKNLKKN